MKYYSSLFLVMLYSSLCNLYAQALSANADSVSAIFSNYLKVNNEQEIVVQTDRSVYIAGEKIWFKADVINNVSAGIYKNLFVDLVNDNDDIIDQLVLDNMHQHTNGVVELPDSIPTGFYWIRAYTAKQIRVDTLGAFLKPIFILNKKLHDQSSFAAQYERKYRSTTIKPVIHFFAERVSAIPGILSTGVVEIKDSYQNPLSAKGSLVNSKDSVIANFTTNALGLARVTFINDPVEKYNVVFNIGNTTIKYPLVTVPQNEAQLSVARQTSKTIKAFVTLEPSLPAGMHTTILAVKRDSLCYAAVGSGSYGITIPLENFPAGIVSLLLFNDNKELLSERKIFVSNDDVQLEVKASKKKYDARDNAVIHLKLSDSKGNPIIAPLNIAVQDEWITQFADSIDAQALPPMHPLLLENWLAINKNKYTPDDIDLLMATLTTNDLHQDQYTNEVITKYDDNSKLLNLTGKITDRKGNVIDDRVVTLVTKNVQGFFMDVDTTSKDGTFNLPIPQGIDSLKLSLQVTDKHKAQRLEDSIIIDGFNFPEFATPLALKQQYMSENINTVFSLRKYHIDTAITFQGKGWLTPVTVTTVKKEEPNYDVSKRINSISQILTSDQLKNSYNSIGYKLLTVPGVSLAFGDITIFGPSLDMYGHVGRPLLVVDGVAMGPASIGYFNGLLPTEVDFIEVLRGGEAGIYGMRAGNGVISVNTKHGPDKIDYSKTNFKSFTPVTYHTAPKFPMPDYSNKETKTSAGPDPRTTIYWNANLLTNKNGEADVNFFTADNATNYTVTVTGVTAKGELIYKRITINNSGKIK